VRAIDLMHLGHDRVICCYAAGDLLVDPGPASCLQALLQALEGRRPRGLLLTHVHLDHAGASGSLVRRWPDLEVYVHKRGARHLSDPSRLLRSARRLYGEDLERLWGPVEPVPRRNLRVLAGGEELAGGWQVAHVPGHASHHVAYRHDGTAFVGDVGGVRIPPSRLVIPPTPPPDIDVDAWHRSIELVAAWRPERVAVTHFGAFEDVDAHLEDLARRLDAWAAVARDGGRDAFIARVGEEIGRGSGDDLATAAAFAQATPVEQQYAGLERYWRKRDPLPS
jgi:glyoxylase-like metal-dependent hydrolase (beta-lactamase superfamily II)